MASEEGASTLMAPPPKDPAKAPIEHILEVTEMSVLGKDIFTNARQPWHPPWARGIYGGLVIAQCLAAAQRTVPDSYLVHSCHCYFLLAGAADAPLMLHVERVRDGRSFAARTVQARQRGRCIFTTTVSFVRPGSGGRSQARHAVPLPADVAGPPPDAAEPSWARSAPFQSARIEVLRGRDDAARPDQRKCRQWVRCRGAISAAGGHQAHLNALAYVSDSYFIGTVSRVHRLWRFPFAPEDVPALPAEARRQVEQVSEFEGMGSGVDDWADRPRLTMLVSLDHSIYFHEPLRVRADDWMFTEMESPWAGDGRGLVFQRIYGKDGTLLATCVQEGVVRLNQDGAEEGSRL